MLTLGCIIQHCKCQQAGGFKRQPHLLGSQLLLLKLSLHLGLEFLSLLLFTNLSLLFNCLRLFFLHSARIIKQKVTTRYCKLKKKSNTVNEQVCIVPWHFLATANCNSKSYPLAVVLEEIVTVNAFGFRHIHKCKIQSGYLNQVPMSYWLKLLDCSQSFHDSATSQD